jgi:hypothetical protein
VEQERALRAANGEQLRPGRHAGDCRRDHPSGPCNASSRPRPSGRKKR